MEITGIEFLKILPGVALFPFSAYFAWKKISHKILVSYSIDTNSTSARKISNIILSNMKDKPVCIFSLHAIINKDISLPIEEFSPPLIIKPLESILINTSEVSNYHIGSDEFEIDFDHKIEIYALTYNKAIKCRVENPPSINSFQERSKYRFVTKHTQKFNGHVYNESVLYAIVYSQDGVGKTAFVQAGGFISHEWGFRYNMVPENMLNSAEGIQEFLQLPEIAIFCKNFHVEPLNEKRTQ